MLPIHYVPIRKVSTSKKAFDSLTADMNKNKMPSDTKVLEMPSENKVPRAGKKTGDELWIVEALSRELPIF